MQSIVLMALFTVGLLSLLWQSGRNVAVKIKVGTPSVAIVIPSPVPTQRTVSIPQHNDVAPVAPTPTPTSTPSATPKSPPVGQLPTKTVALVKPSPNSSVNNLTPASVAKPSPSPSSSPGPGSSSNTLAPLSSYDYSSSNWSGYLTTTTAVEGISASWIVPSVTGNGYSISADAVWIGIGGVTTSDLIQVGTQDIVLPSGATTTTAFYETLPEAASNITGMMVHSGDAMTASLTELSAGTWQIAVTDVTEHEVYVTDVSYASSGSTAEGIVEDPSYYGGHQLAFDNVSRVEFTSATVSINGGTESLANTNPQSIEMIKGDDQAVEVPSALSPDGLDFDVTAH